MKCPQDGCTGQLRVETTREGRTDRGEPLIIRYRYCTKCDLSAKTSERGPSGGPARPRKPVSRARVSQ